ncbi:hypothetical protein Pcinc_019050 [Petrolisthes cinctipes]|uniref:Prokineticin domain-containing protein n=1 Tax=Petrolisthes cinctipes TaxID=88211 RepID=A0AAE1KM22_PETCI|nr:hypothetical protein Pcinc_019050 [Petrolisthes cinctipes]
MIPSWWINARAQQACAGRGDCGPDECCVRPMLAANAYCIKYSDEGHSCDPSAMLVDMENEVYFDHCPCFSHLTCVNFRYNSRCVNPDTLSLLTGHRFAPVPNPVQIGDPIPVPKQTQGM